MTEENRTEKLLSQINERVKQLVALTAAGQIAGLKQTAAVEKLGSFGLSAKEISEITGFSHSSVAPILSRAKTTKGKRK